MNTQSKNKQMCVPEDTKATVVEMVARSDIRTGDAVRTLWKNYVRPSKRMENVQAVATHDVKKGETVTLVCVEGMYFEP